MCMCVCLSKLAYPCNPYTFHRFGSTVRAIKPPFRMYATLANVNRNVCKFPEQHTYTPPITSRFIISKTLEFQ